MTVKQGDTVLVKNPTRTANGSEIHVGIVTAVHPALTGKPMVNLKVLPDMNGYYDMGSVVHRDDCLPGTSPNAPYWFERE